jgi:hypothetical protein
VFILVVLIALFRRSQDGVSPSAGQLDLQASAKPSLETPEGSKELAAPPPSIDSRVEPADEDHLLVVCVVDDQSGAVVEGAQVLISDGLKAGALLRANNTTVETPAGRRLRRGIAQEATTGKDGCTDPIPCPEQATIEARVGDRWGVVTVNSMPEDHRVTVRLTQDLSVRVRVVRPDGAPRDGVPVALRRATDAPDRLDRVTESEAPDGVATFEHYQRRLLQGDGWRFAFAFPVAGDASVSVDASAQQEPLSELMLPGAGHILIRARNDQGKVPQGEEIRLQLSAFDDARNGEELYAGGAWSKVGLKPDGQAEIPWVGLGLRIRVEARIGEAKCGLVSFEGPSREGETVECELLVDDQPRTLAGRLVFANGEPWVSTSMGAFLVGLPPNRSGPGSNYNITTDENGRFRLPITEEPSSAQPFVLKLAAQQARASVAIESEVPPSGLDLGDVVLDHGRVLLAGRVVDASGQPIARATLDLRLAVHAIEGNADPSSDRGKATRSQEHSLATTAAHSAPDGSFTFFAREEEQHGTGTQLSLTTSCRGYVADVARPVQLGEEGVVVRLSAAGSLEGTLDLPEGMTLDELELELIAAGGRKHSLRPKEDRFRFESLAEDSYSLRVRSRHWRLFPDRPPLAQVDGIQVLVGQTSRDPRLQPWRIEDGRTLVRVRVVDEDAAPISNAWVIHRGSESWTLPLTDGSGLCPIRVQSLPIDAEVGASGYGKQRPVFDGEDVTVVLRRGVPVRFHTNVDASAAEYQLRIQLFDVEADGNRGEAAIRMGPREEDVLDAGPDSPPVLLGPGTYECVPVIKVSGRAQSAGGPVDLTEAARITVRDSPSEQEFEIEIPQSELDAAVAKYKSM